MTVRKEVPGRMMSFLCLNQHRQHTAHSRLLIITYPGIHGLYFVTPGVGYWVDTTRCADRAREMFSCCTNMRTQVQSSETT